MAGLNFSGHNYCVVLDGIFVDLGVEFNNNLISVISVISQGTVRIALIEWVKRLKVVSGGFQYRMTGSILRFG